MSIPPRRIVFAVVVVVVAVQLALFTSSVCVQAAAAATTSITTNPAKLSQSRLFGIVRPSITTSCTTTAVVSAIHRGGADTDHEDTATTASRNKKSNHNNDNSEYRTLLQNIQSNVVRSIIQNMIEPLRIQIVEQNQMVDSFGTRCDDIINTAMELFDEQVNAASATTTSPPPPSSSDDYDATLTELVTLVDTPLQLLYMKQLAMIRDTVMETYRTQSATSKSTYEAMVQADHEFVRLATAATRSSTSSQAPPDEWDSTYERNYLQSILSLAADATYKTNEVQMNSAQQQQTAMTFLQSQQQMIQQLQSQLYGQTSPWNVGMAYRIPDTNFNLQGSYQQGRANVQLSCVPDEYAPFLGPNGFTNGVGPGNLGLSLNLSL